MVPCSPPPMRAWLVSRVSRRDTCHTRGLGDEGQRRQLASVVDPVAREPQRYTPRKRRASIQARKLP